MIGVFARIGYAVRNCTAPHNAFAYEISNGLLPLRRGNAILGPFPAGPAMNKGGGPYEPSRAFKKDAPPIHAPGAPAHGQRLRAIPVSVARTDLLYCLPLLAHVRGTDRLQGLYCH